MANALLVIFILWGFIPLLLAVMSLRHFNVGSAVLCLYAIGWGLATIGLFRKRRWGWRIALGVVLPIWGLAIAQLIRRIVFIVVNGGMDRADEPGSPMAFVLGLAAELILLLLPLSTILMLLIACRRQFGGSELALRITQ